jgi:hypothetical protein
MKAQNTTKANHKNKKETRENAYCSSNKISTFVSLYFDKFLLSALSSTSAAFPAKNDKV